MPSSSRVTVVIPTLLRPSLVRLVSSLVEQAHLQDVICISGDNPPAQRNAGAKMARSEFVVFIDDDCVADPRLLERGVEYMTAHGLDVMSGRVAGGVETRRPWRTFFAGNLWVRRPALVLIKFDESLSQFEDIDFAWQAMDAGIAWGHCDSAVVYHVGPEASRGRVGEMVTRDAARKLRARWPERWDHLCRHDSVVLSAESPNPAGNRFALLEEVL